MTLRFKIALGVVVVPVLTAAVLIILMNSAIGRATRDIADVNARNQRLLTQRAQEWQSALEQRGMQQVADWIDANLKNQSAFAITFLLLPKADLFESAHRLNVSDLDTDRPLPPPTRMRGPQDFRFSDLDRTKASEAVDLWRNARDVRDNPDPAAVSERPAIASAGNVFYWAHSDGEDSPEHVFRLAIRAFPLEPPELVVAGGVDSQLGDLVGSAARTLALGTILLLLVLVVGVRLLVTRPLEQLLAGSKRVAEGDFGQPIPSPGTGDEIGRLVAAFNRMQEEVRAYQSEMQQRIDDATDQIREQERSLVVAQRLAATGTLAAGLAHEINNPVGGMQNVVRRLRKSVTDPKQIEYLDLMDDGLRRIESLMRQLLGFSRRRDAEPREYGIHEAVESATALVAYRFEGDATLDVLVPRDLPKLFGDPDAMAQVITNLLLNARDALKDSRGQVIVRAYSRPTASSPTRSEVVLELADDGIGMDEATRSRIFDPFFTTKETGKGTGLGLSIAHTVVHSHGGTISVTSELGRGTTFTIVVPQAG